MTEKIMAFQVRLHTELVKLTEGEEGMATAEYAIGTLAAAAFAGVLMVVVKGGAIKTALTELIQKALAG